MSKRRVFEQGQICHVYNRGNKKQDTFLDLEDYEYYKRKLKQYSLDLGVTILCYCLMPNHLHLVTKQCTEFTPSHLIQRLHTSYSMYFNKKYQTVGHVFQNRFKYRAVTTDQYLFYLSCYVHLNPVRLIEKLSDYKHSSLSGFLGKGDEILSDPNWILNYLGYTSRTYFRVINELKKDSRRLSFVDDSTDEEKVLRLFRGLGPRSRPKPEPR